MNDMTDPQAKFVVDDVRYDGRAWVVRIAQDIATRDAYEPNWLKVVIEGALPLWKAARDVVVKEWTYSPTLPLADGLRRGALAKGMELAEMATSRNFWQAGWKRMADAVFEKTKPDWNYMAPELAASEASRIVGELLADREEKKTLASLTATQHAENEALHRRLSDTVNALMQARAGLEFAAADALEPGGGYTDGTTEEGLCDKWLEMGAKAMDGSLTLVLTDEARARLNAVLATYGAKGDYPPKADGDRFDAAAEACLIGVDGLTAVERARAAKEAVEKELEALKALHADCLKGGTFVTLWQHEALKAELKEVAEALDGEKLRADQLAEQTRNANIQLEIMVREDAKFREDSKTLLQAARDGHAEMEGRFKEAYAQLNRERERAERCEAMLADFGKVIDKFNPSAAFVAPEGQAAELERFLAGVKGQTGRSPNVHRQFHDQVVGDLKARAELATEKHPFRAQTAPEAFFDQLLAMADTIGVTREITTLSMLGSISRVLEGLVQEVDAALKGSASVGRNLVDKVRQIAKVAVEAKRRGDDEHAGRQEALKRVSHLEQQIDRVRKSMAKERDDAAKTAVEAAEEAAESAATASMREEQLEELETTVRATAAAFAKTFRTYDVVPPTPCPSDLEDALRWCGDWTAAGFRALGPKAAAHSAAAARNMALDDILDAAMPWPNKTERLAHVEEAARHVKELEQQRADLISELNAEREGARKLLERFGGMPNESVAELVERLWKRNGDERSSLLRKCWDLDARLGAAKRVVLWVNELSPSSVPGEIAWAVSEFLAHDDTPAGEVCGPTVNLALRRALTAFSDAKQRVHLTVVKGDELFEASAAFLGDVIVNVLPRSAQLEEGR